MQQEIAYTSKTSIQDAVDDITSQLHISSTPYNLLIFFASSIYDFKGLTDLFHHLYPDTQVIGVSSGGAIHKTGFKKHGLLITTMSDPEIKLSSTMIENVNTYPIIHKDKIERALKECEIDITKKDFPSHSFALTFINGLMDHEQSFLSMIYAIMGTHDFKLVGGSAGDDYRFQKTKVSLNGIVSNDGAVITFINTKKRFQIYNYNCFKKTGKKLHITKCDLENYRILEINGMPPLTAYAKELGISSTALKTSMFDHPLGRTFGEITHITSLLHFNVDKTLKIHTRITNDQDLNILEPDDILAMYQDACKQIVSDFNNPGFLFFILCTGNMISFEHHGFFKSITDITNRFLGHYCGFASYGEQLGGINLNQTMLILAMEE